MTHEIDIGGQQGRGNPIVGHDDGRDPDRPHWAPAFWYAVLSWALVWLAWVSVCELIDLIQN
jgi:hypothetical protein